MVVFVHSLGSLWQEKNLPAGGTRIWNTTGIRARLPRVLSTNPSEVANRLRNICRVHQPPS